MAGGGGDITAPRGNLWRRDAALQVSDRAKLRKEEKNGKESDLAFNPFIPLHVHTSFQSRGPKRVSDRVRESTTRLREHQAHQTRALSHGSTPGCFQLHSHTRILLSAGQLQNTTALYSLHPAQHFQPLLYSAAATARVTPSPVPPAPLGAAAQTGKEPGPWPAPAGPLSISRAPRWAPAAPGHQASRAPSLPGWWTRESDRK